MGSKGSLKFIITPKLFKKILVVVVFLCNFKKNPWEFQKLHAYKANPPRSSLCLQNLFENISTYIKINKIGRGWLGGGGGGGGDTAFSC